MPGQPFNRPRDGGRVNLSFDTETDAGSTLVDPETDSGSTFVDPETYAGSTFESTQDVCVVVCSWIAWAPLVWGVTYNTWHLLPAGRPTPDLPIYLAFQTASKGDERRTQSQGGGSDRLGLRRARDPVPRVLKKPAGRQGVPFRVTPPRCQMAAPNHARRPCD